MSSLSLFSSPPVLAELQLAGLIPRKECEGLVYLSHVVEVQSGKSPEVLFKSANVLKRHGFEKESTRLASKQTQPLLHVPVVCCTVEPVVRAT